MKTHQQALWQNIELQLKYAELFNALYVRESQRLSHFNELSRLQRALRSLPHYVEKAVDSILTGSVPLHLDTYNACWFSNTQRSPKWLKHESVKFYSTLTDVGLVVPVLSESDGKKIIQLDCIDQVRSDRLHCNESGWFSLEGENMTTKSWLLKPSKPLLVSAACGHQWLFGKKAAPRLLSLREMLLATSINWHRVQKKKCINK